MGLTKEATQFLKQAQNAYADGLFDVAIPAYLEVVRLAPNLPDPYHALGCIYELRQDDKNAISYFLHAASLQKTDPARWRDLATQCIRQQRDDDTLRCIQHVLHAEPNDVNALWEQAKLYHKQGKTKKEADSLSALLQASPGHVEAVSSLVRAQDKLGNKKDACALLSRVLDGMLSMGGGEGTPTAAAAGAPAAIDDTLKILGMLLELLIEQRQWADALQRVSAVEAFCAAPDVNRRLTLQVEVQAAICKLFLNQAEAADAAFAKLKKEYVNNPQYNELRLQVAQSNLEAKRFKEAHDMATTLVDHRNYADRAQRIVASALESLGHLEEAAKAYDKALQRLGEDSLETINLSAWLHLRRGKAREALAVLDHKAGDGAAQPPDIKSRTLRGIALFRLRRIDAAIDELYDLVRASVLGLESEIKQVGSIKRKKAAADEAAAHDELEPDPPAPGTVPTLASTTAPTSGLGELTDLLLRHDAAVPTRDVADNGSDSCSAAAAAAMPPPPPRKRKLAQSGATVPTDHVRADATIYDKLGADIWVAALIALAEALWESRGVHAAREVLKPAVRVVAVPAKQTPTRLQGLSFDKEAELSMLLIKIECACSNPSDAYELVRKLCMKEPTNDAWWTLCGYVTGMMRPKSVKYDERWALRLLNKHGDRAPVVLTAAHRSLSKRSWSMAIALYSSLADTNPNDPLLYLCLGVCYMQTVLTRRMAKKKGHLALVGESFLRRYEQLRGNRMEAAYNIGRAYHHIGLLSLATDYYMHVLAMDPTPVEVARGNVQREAAHNLAILLQANGSPSLASSIRQTFLSG